MSTTTVPVPSPVSLSGVPSFPCPTFLPSGRQGSGSPGPVPPQRSVAGPSGTFPTPAGRRELVARYSVEISESDGWTLVRSGHRPLPPGPPAAAVDALVDRMATDWAGPSLVRVSVEYQPRRSARPVVAWRVLMPVDTGRTRRQAGRRHTA